MKEYYIVIDDEKHGPFSIEELRGKKISPDTLIWTEEFEEWTEAKNFEELKDILKKTPPPIPKHANVEKKELQISTETKILLAKELKINFKYIRYALLIGIISIPIFFNYYGGFTHVKMYNKWEKYNFSWRSSEYEGKTHQEKEKIRLSDLEKRRAESELFGWRWSNSYPIPTDWHKKEYKEIAEVSFLSALKIVLITWLIIILGRYIIIGARWVDDTSKKKVT